MILYPTDVPQDERCYIHTESDMTRDPPPRETRNTVYVYSESAVSDMVDNLFDSLTKDSRSISIDLEPTDSQDPISMMNINDSFAKRSYLIDVLILGKDCFSITGKSHRTLNDIIQDPKVVKNYFTVK
ncbi:3 -5 exonuclease [Fusarium longipes]|uniref:3-5 exonuclease n=1 Tax=Fusarium longipes TaxID=694270 RepID=A0A395T491_9HYPO|nr:3 -5 exonuclease [Fusarium longipes]